MKKYLFIVSALLFVFACSGADSAEADIARVHVIANSDSEGDIALKNAVAAEVVKLLGENEASGDIRNALELSLDDVMRASNRVLEESGADYGAKAEVGVKHFERRSLGSSAFPEGEYLALTVTLGEGRGTNWWGVLFPDVAFEASLAFGEEQGKGKTVVFSDGRIIRIRSLLFEMLQKCNNLMLTN